LTTVCECCVFRCVVFCRSSPNFIRRQFFPGFLLNSFCSPFGTQACTDCDFFSSPRIVFRDLPFSRDIALVPFQTISSFNPRRSRRQTFLTPFNSLFLPLGGSFLLVLEGLLCRFHVRSFDPPPLDCAEPFQAPPQFLFSVEGNFSKALVAKRIPSVCALQGIFLYQRY